MKEFNLDSELYHMCIKTCHVEIGAQADIDSTIRSNHWSSFIFLIACHLIYETV